MNQLTHSWCSIPGRLFCALSQEHCTTTAFRNQECSGQPQLLAGSYTRVSLHGDYT